MDRRWLLWLLIVTFTGLTAVAFAGAGVSTGLRTPGVSVLAPVQSLIRGAVDTTVAIVSAVRDIGGLAEENRQLERQIEELQGQVIQLREAGEENRQLRALLDFERDNPGREYLPATIIAHDPNNLVRSVVINRGTEQGLQKGMVVVNEVGLVGKVVEAYPNASKVLLLIDPSSVVNALVQRSRAQGIVTGRSDAHLRLQYVQKGADVGVGDLVVSSGLGGGHPKGLLLGSVSYLTSNDQEPFQTIRLAPAVQIASLETVLVVKDFAPIKLP